MSVVYSTTYYNYKCQFVNGCCMDCCRVPTGAECRLVNVTRYYSVCYGRYTLCAVLLLQYSTSYSRYSNLKKLRVTAAAVRDDSSRQLIFFFCLLLVAYHIQKDGMITKMGEMPKDGEQVGRTISNFDIFNIWYTNYFNTLRDNCKVVNPCSVKPLR